MVFLGVAPLEKRSIHKAGLSEAGVDSREPATRCETSRFKIKKESVAETTTIKFFFLRHG